MLGVDLSDLSIKLIDLKQKGSRKEVVSFINYPLPEHALQQGEIKNIDLTSKTLRQALNQAKIKTSQISASLPEVKAFLSIVELNNINQQDLAKALKLEIEQHIPFKISEVYLDSKILRQNQTGASILLAAVPKKIVDGYLEVFKLAKLTPLVLEIESIATARCLVKETPSAGVSAILIIDLSSKYTNFIIYDQGTISFSKTVNIASVNFTEALRQALKTDFSEAEKEKRRWGLDIKARQGLIFKALKPLIETLVSETKKTISFYENRHSDAVINKIILTGGSSNLKGLDAYLSLRLTKEVTKGDPWLNIKPESKKRFTPAIPKEQVLNFSTAIGLALRGLNFDFAELEE